MVQHSLLGRSKGAQKGTTRFKVRTADLAEAVGRLPLHIGWTLFP